MQTIQLDKANSKLDRIKIMQRGSRLTLRGTLPPKPGDGDKPKQYTISPGLPATPEGLKLAVVEAQKIEADLIYDRFSWTTDTQRLTIEKAVAEFEKHYWATRKKTVSRANNYKYDYLNFFLFLPQDELLSVELLKKALLTTEPDSRQRKFMTTAFCALLKHFQIDNDLNKYKGNYQPVRKRQIPTFEEIDRYYAMMRSPQWRWVFGIIACYGIRPHEIFHLDCNLMSDYPPALIVKEGTKTGGRLVYPIPDAIRVKLWKLNEPVLPNINTAGKSNMELGRKIGQKFNELNIPSPYHFRDAYAIHGEIYNYNPALVAQWMGHSLDVHYKRYLRHINQKHFTNAWLRHQQP